MKRKPIIINTSRGDLVNENDISMQYQIIILVLI